MMDMETDVLPGTGAFVITLEQEGSFLMFDRYKLFVEPIYFTLETAFAGTTLYNGDTELAEASNNDFSKQVGPFLPGIYTFSAEYKNDYLDLKQEEEIEVTPYNNNDTYYLSVDAGVVHFDTILDESVPSRLIINGEKVEFNVFTGEPFGPVTFDGSMEVAIEADFPWGTATTKTLPLENEYFLVEFPMDKKMEESLGEALENYYISNADALNNKDITLIENLSENLKEDVSDELYRYSDEEYIFEKNITNLEMDMDNFYLVNTDEGLQMTVYVRETLKSDYYHQEDEADIYEKEIIWEYTLLYQKDEWTILNKVETWGVPADFGDAKSLVTEPISITLDNSLEEIAVEEEAEESDSSDGLSTEDVDKSADQKVEELLAELEQVEIDPPIEFVSKTNIIPDAYPEIISFDQVDGFSVIEFLRYDPEQEEWISFYHNAEHENMDGFEAISFLGTAKFSEGDNYYYPVFGYWTGSGGFFGFEMFKSDEQGEVEVALDRMDGNYPEGNIIIDDLEEFKLEITSKGEVVETITKKDLN